MKMIKDFNGKILNGREAYMDEDGYLFLAEDLENVEYSEDAGGYTYMGGREVLLDDEISDAPVYELVEFSMRGEMSYVKEER